MEALNIPSEASNDVTLWFRMNERGGFDFNHLEDGHALTDNLHKSIPVKAAGKKSTWVKELAWFDGSNPPKVLHDPQHKRRGFLPLCLDESRSE